MPQDSERILTSGKKVTTREEGYSPRIEAILKNQPLSPLSETGGLTVRKLRNEIHVANNGEKE
jgi:hypothetical protein